VAALPLDRQVGERVETEERCSRNVRFEVPLTAGLDAQQVVAAVDEPVLDQ
jgi:hypothetical protein